MEFGEVALGEVALGEGPSSSSFIAITSIFEMDDQHSNSFGGGWNLGLTYGTRLTPNQQIQIGALGFYSGNPNGIPFTGSGTLAIMATDGTVLRSVNFNQTFNIRSQYLFSITPLTLSANTTYWFLNWTAQDFVISYTPSTASTRSPHNHTTLSFVNIYSEDGGTRQTAGTSGSLDSAGILTAAQAPDSLETDWVLQVTSMQQPVTIVKRRRLMVV